MSKTQSAQIFVQIASYDDDDLVPTILDAREKAHGAVTFGVCWQSDRDPPSLPSDVAVTPIRSLETKGVGWGRQQAQRHWTEEPYVLQIDSHMAFAYGWDQYLLETIEHLPPRSVISAYAAGFERWDFLERKKATRVIPNLFNKYDVLRFRAGPGIRQTEKGHLICCHYLFGPAEFWQEVPPDPSIQYNGEEVALSVRAFTHGWDVYHPGRTAIYHKYNQSGRSILPPKAGRWHEQSIRRVQTVCGYGQECLGKWGLGSLRTLSEFERATGINFQSREITACPF